jgi:hypothetical protein
MTRMMRTGERNIQDITINSKNIFQVLFSVFINLNNDDKIRIKKPITT